MLLVHEEPDETVLSYLEMKERIHAMRGSMPQIPAHATNQADGGESRTERRQRAQRRKRRTERRTRPTLNYYRPVSAAVPDRITRAQDFRVLTVPAVRPNEWKIGIYPVGNGHNPSCSRHPRLRPWL